MAINVIETSVKMNNAGSLRTMAPTFTGGPNPTAHFDSGRVSFAGECEIAGAAGDNPAGWTLGIIQLQWIETNWGWYRGQTQKDGSIFEQRARPPARPAQGCRDANGPSDIFYWNGHPTAQTVAATGQQLPFKMTAKIEDQPSEGYQLVRTNSKTGKPNYLYKAQLEFHFCTVLALMSPAKKYQFLKHLLWNVHWEYEIQANNISANVAAINWSARPTAGGNSSSVSQVFDGAPSDPRFLPILTAPGVPNCNQVARQAETARNLKESAVWEMFSVTR
jgi:hypothetical protein